MILVVMMVIIATLITFVIATLINV